MFSRSFRSINTLKYNKVHKRKLKPNHAQVGVKFFSACRKFDMFHFNGHGHAPIPNKYPICMTCHTTIVIFHVKLVMKLCGDYSCGLSGIGAAYREICDKMQLPKILISN